MEELLIYRQRLLDRYADIAAEMGQFSASIPQEDRAATECEGWSLHKTLAHLRDVEAGYFQPLYRRLLSGEDAPAGRYELQAWERQDYDPNEPLETILADLARLHRQEADTLRGLEPQGWNRACRHPVWGERTLQWWVEQSLAHSTQHLRQLRACFAGVVV